MALNYDFDMFDVVPSDVSDDPELRHFLNGAGFRTETETGQIALFRDPRTAEALRHAPEALRGFFLESGFGLNTYDSGAAFGRYPAKDETARLGVIARLTENAPRFHLTGGATETGATDFCLSDFLEQLAKAIPVEPPSYADGAVDSISPLVPKNQASVHPQQGRMNLLALSSRLLQAMPRFGHFGRGNPAS